MDITLINALWEIGKTGWSTWLLFIFGIMLWNKLDKKDQKIYDLIEVISKMNQTIEIQNEKLQSMNQILLQILNNTDK